MYQIQVTQLFLALTINISNRFQQARHPSFPLKKNKQAHQLLFIARGVKTQHFPECCANNNRFKKVS